MVARDSRVRNAARHDFDPWYPILSAAAVIDSYVPGSPGYTSSRRTQLAFAALDSTLAWMNRTLRAASEPVG